MTTEKKKDRISQPMLDGLRWLGKNPHDWKLLATSTLRALLRRDLVVHAKLSESFQRRMHVGQNTHGYQLTSTGHQLLTSASPTVTGTAGPSATGLEPLPERLNRATVDDVERMLQCGVITSAEAELHVAHRNQNPGPPKALRRIADELEAIAGRME